MLNRVPNTEEIIDITVVKKRLYEQEVKVIIVREHK